MARSRICLVREEEGGVSETLFPDLALLGHGVVQGSPLGLEIDDSTSRSV